MKSIFTTLFILLFQFTYSQQVNWNGYRITYVGKTSISKKMDANPNTKLRIENISNNAALPFYFDLFIEGFTAPSAERNLHGEFGFATFPNGGAIQIPIGQQSFAQTWTQGVYESRMGNVPPLSGSSKIYKMHFLFSENQGALQGPYPKNSSTVLDFPVDIQFVNDDTMQLYRSGNKAIRLAINAKSAGNFNIELFTESGGPQQSNNLYQNTLVQAGNGSNIPYFFDFNLAARNDWFVKIRKPGKKSEYFKLNTDESINTFSLTEETIATSPYKVQLIKSIKTKTGFWRGAVSEKTKTFVCIPGQENWANTSSPKNASRLYKIDFDGNILWTKDIGWEAWGGDMTSDGKFVSVASNGVIGPTPLNGNRGGDFIAVLNGIDGSIYDTILGIQSRNVKFSSDGKHLAIGDQSGTFHVYDMVTKKLVITKAGLTSYGQNRELVWIDNDNAILISTGDGNLYKYNLSTDKKTTTLVWKAYTGGWGFINGLTVSKNGLYIGTGTKSKDQTIINAATGAVVWTKYTGLFDVSFTPDANRMATFGGFIFRTDNGNFLGHTGRAGVAAFSPDGKYLMQADRVQVTNGQFGDNSISIMNDIGDKLLDFEGKSNYYDSLDLTNTGGEQVQWAYWSEDGKRIISLSRDMDLTEEVGISIFSLDTCSIAAPSVTNINLCQGATASALTATALSGNSLRWYGTNATGGTASSTAPTPSTSATGTTDYYVSQITTAIGCESARSKISVMVNAVPAAPVVSNTTYCVGSTSSTLTATALSGNSLRWYGTSATGGTASSTAPTLSTTTAGTLNYYVSQITTASGCESPRSNLGVTINVLPSAPSVTNATYCVGSTASALSATATSGNTLSWYGLNATGGTASTSAPVPSTSAAGTLNYYVSQIATATGCESPRTSLGVTINALPSAPSVTSATFCVGSTASALSATATSGNTLKWYGLNATGGTASTSAPVPSTSAAGTVNYYVSQVTTATGCESPRANLVVGIYNTPNAPVLSRDLNNFLVTNVSGITWFRDGVQLLDTTQKIKPTIAGSYTVKTTQNGCASSMSTPYYFLVTDVINLSATEFIKLVPNPFINYMNIDFVVKGHQRMNIDVFSAATGAKVATRIAVTAGSRLTFNELTPGIYFVRVASPDMKVSHQFKMVKL